MPSAPDVAGRSAALEGSRQRRRGAVRWAGPAAVAGMSGALAAAVAGAGTGEAVAAAVASAAAVAGVGRLALRRADPGRWERGAAGEAATAALLEALPARRWVVLHDRAVPRSRANIDHLVVGPTGVWVVDSKAYRAPLRAGWHSVRAGDRALDTGPVAWEASVVSEVLGGVDVRPLVAVHGDGLPRRGRRVGGVRVVPAAEAVARIRRRRGSAHLGRRRVAALAAMCDSLLAQA